MSENIPDTFIINIKPNKCDIHDCNESEVYQLKKNWYCSHHWYLKLNINPNIPKRSKVCEQVYEFLVLNPNKPFMPLEVESHLHLDTKTVRYALNLLSDNRNIIKAPYFPDLRIKLYYYPIPV